MSRASHRFFAVCPRGLQELLGEELRGIGAHSPSPVAGGVAFEADLATAWAANLHSRLASRVLWRVAGGSYRDESDLYALAHAVEWEGRFRPDRTLRVDVTAIRSPLRSLQFATLKIKDAIADRMRERCGSRPSIDRERPDVQVVAHLTADRAELYLDLSGEPLFKRGWRADKGEAPLKENLAAALLALSGWSPASPLHDPFCGSGTIPIEAACIATRRAPGLGREFAFRKLLDFDEARWRELRQQALDAIDERAAFRITGRDISTRIVQLAATNAGHAGLAASLRSGQLSFEAGDAREAPAPGGHGTIVTNPPYGIQSEPKSATVARLMSHLGDQLKRAYPGWTAWMLSGDLNLPSQLKLKESRRTVLYNGPIECRLFRFELVAGGYRTAKAPEPEAG